ncbi:type II toxin-antitoxin system VapC family toxin [Candidatus Bathyarchaeota archaeon]|nr:type II toxin-antitoxin system VapC family toxin [Candidatus Bathyarchaeota archaeon]
MTVLIDTGFFVAFHNSRDVNHGRAVTLMQKLLEGEYGQAYTTDYVFDEAVTVALMRTGRHDLAVEIGRLILGDGSVKFVTMLHVGETGFHEAWTQFTRYPDHTLSFTDCVSIALMRNREIDLILSFDSDFDGILNRVY